MVRFQLSAEDFSVNRVEEYARAIDRIHKHGIAVQAGIVFGFDEDTESIFGETLDFLEAAGVQNATFNILTPYPGTPLYRRFETEGRILIPLRMSNIMIIIDV
jgi:biotin synthase-like enzyme